MNLSGLDIKPAEGKIAVRFVDDLDEDPVDAPGTPGADYEGLLAIVVAVGDGVKGVKKGATIVTQPWARDGLKLGDDLVLIDSYCIAATLT